MRGGISLDSPYRFPWYRRRAAFAMAFVVLSAGAIGYSYYVLNPPPAASKELPPSSPYPLRYDLMGRGNFSLFLPLMTAYTPDVSFPNLTYTTRVVLASNRTVSADVAFAWSNVALPSLPVRFLWRDASVFGFEDPDGGFLVSPAGCGVGCGASSISTEVVSPHRGIVIRMEVLLDYFVWKVTPLPPLDWISWLQVEYWLTDYVEGVWDLDVPLPRNATLSLPGPEDLVLVDDNVTVWLDPQYNTTHWYSLGNFDLPIDVFHHTLPEVTFNAGPYGQITSRPRSSFSWVPTSSYTIKIEGTASEHLTLAMYVDARFGSLYPHVLT